MGSGTIIPEGHSQQCFMSRWETVELIGSFLLHFGFTSIFLRGNTRQWFLGQSRHWGQSDICSLLSSQKQFDFITGKLIVQLFSTLSQLNFAFSNKFSVIIHSQEWYTHINHLFDFPIFPSNRHDENKMWCL